MSRSHRRSRRRLVWLLAIILSILALGLIWAFMAYLDWLIGPEVSAPQGRGPRPGGRDGVEGEQLLPDKPAESDLALLRLRVAGWSVGDALFTDPAAVENIDD